ncbi:MAG: peptidoglycan-binding protein, partial [Clostridiales bacterium]|nr:peptidoglycan-binding protein [Clostridiales bacterium]
MRKQFLKKRAAVAVIALLAAALWLLALGATYTKLPKSDVQEIQRRLKAWGYYSGNVDGIYGDQTYRAVRYFQSKNGLAVDGIVGS